jgi:hypothetical protein
VDIFRFLLDRANGALLTVNSLEIVVCSAFAALEASVFTVAEDTSFETCPQYADSIK